MALRPPTPPEGYATPPPPWRYEIRCADVPGAAVVEHLTVDARRWIAGNQRHYRCLAPEDQAFADEIAMLVQQACGYFYLPDEDTIVERQVAGMTVKDTRPAYVPMEGVPDVVVTDAEVLERIEALDKGENLREAVRSEKERYPLVDLPFDQQRALIEQVEACKKRHSFEWLGEVESAPQVPEPEGPVSL